MKKIIPLALLLTAAIAAALLLAMRTTRAEHRLTELYQAALDQSCEDLGEMELALEKLLISADAAQQTSMLSRVSQTGASLAHSLASMPVSHEALRDTLAFANRASDYADLLLTRIAAEGALPDADREQLTRELAACARLSSEMLLARQSIAFDAAAFTLDESAADYPELTYAGRYGVQASEPAPLTGREVSAQQAERIASELFAPGEVRSVAYTGVTSGPLAAHELTLELADLTVDAALTVTGGHLLWLSPRTAAFETLTDEADCIRSAQAFLAEREFSPMTLVWQEHYNGLAVLTYAAVQDGVTLYADLVHVQVRMDTGTVVGLAASKYLTHHTKRTLPQAGLTSAQAAAQLSGEVTVDSTRLCLLPLYSGETLCHEFRVQWNDSQYLIYVDAQTGREVLLQKLTPTAGGARPA